MIVYDSHRWYTFWQLRGSIFPKAVAWAIPSSAFAFCLKFFDVFALIGDLEEVNNGTIYSGFTFVLGFILVFRTSQSYQRYWTAATAVHAMRTEWLDACGSLVAFAQISKKGTQEISHFGHTMVRLFALMHALALEEIATMEDENFPLLDIEGLEKERLSVLCTEGAQGRKVEIVCSWIKVYILRHMEDGVLGVPAPILTRVFQELGTGLVRYHEALQIVIWPFPFPYAQMSAVLISVYMFVTPVVINLWSSHAWYCAIATFISVVCMKGIDIIAVELENPFGDDANDLPSFQMHVAMNRDLTLLVNPSTWTIPRLLKTARTSHEQLVELNGEQQLSLEQYYKRQEAKMTKGKSFLGLGPSKNAFAVEAQSNYQKQNWTRSVHRVQRVLNIQAMTKKHGGQEAEVAEDTESKAFAKEAWPEETRTADSSSSSPQHLKTGYLQTFSLEAMRAAVAKSKTDESEESLETSVAARPSKWSVGGPTPGTSGNSIGMSEFLQDLSSKLQDHLKQQLEQQNAVYERHLRASVDIIRERHSLVPAPSRTASTETLPAGAASHGGGSLEPNGQCVIEVEAEMKAATREAPSAPAQAWGTAQDSLGPRLAGVASDGTLPDKPAVR